MKTYMKSLHMKNMYPIYIDRYDDLIKIDMCSNQ